MFKEGVAFVENKKMAEAVAKEYISKNLQSLKYPRQTERTFSIVIPKNDNAGNPIKASQRKVIARQMAKRFGGVTAQKVSGYYLGKDKKLQGEQSIVLTSARDLKGKPKDILNTDRKFIKRLAGKARKKFGQEAIMSEEDIIQDVTFTTGRKRQSLDPKQLGDYEELEP
jgi:hypothetical protein